jgi:hypothetical protein
MEICPFRLANNPNVNLNHPQGPKAVLCVGECAWFINKYGCALAVLVKNKLGILKDPPISR